MLVNFPKKSSFDANGKFRVFEMALRDWGISAIGVMWNFAEDIFFVGGGNLARNVSGNYNLFQS